MTKPARQPPPSRRWWTLIVSSVLVVSCGTYPAPKGGGPQEAVPQEIGAQIPNCPVGSLKSVGYGMAPERGTTLWEERTFSSPVEAAQDAFDRYVAAGRVDGRPVDQVSLGVIDMYTFFVPTPGSPDQGEALFRVESLGDRYAVLNTEFCQGAEPTEAFYADEQG